MKLNVEELKIQKINLNRIVFVSDDVVDVKEGVDGLHVGASNVDDVAGQDLSIFLGKKSFEESKIN